MEKYEQSTQIEPNAREESNNQDGISNQHVKLAVISVITLTMTALAAAAIIAYPLGYISLLINGDFAKLSFDDIPSIAAAMFAIEATGLLVLSTILSLAGFGWILWVNRTQVTMLLDAVSRYVRAKYEEDRSQGNYGNSYTKTRIVLALQFLLSLWFFWPSISLLLEARNDPMRFSALFTKFGFLPVITLLFSLSICLGWVYLLGRTGRNR